MLPTFLWILAPHGCASEHITGENDTEFNHLDATRALYRSNFGYACRPRCRKNLTRQDYGLGLQHAPAMKVRKLVSRKQLRSCLQSTHYTVQITQI